jgi:hypothetical protein
MKEAIVNYFLKDNLQWMENSGFTSWTVMQQTWNLNLKTLNKFLNLHLSIDENDR